MVRSETKHIEQYVLDFKKNTSPQANKCKLSNHVGTTQCFHTHRQRLHYFNIHPRRIIANYYSGSICILLPLFHFLFHTCKHTQEVNKKCSRGKKERNHLTKED